MDFEDTISRIRDAVDRQRLVDTAVALIEVPSHTCEAKEVADRLAHLLEEDGFSVERPAAGWAEAPAVVTRWEAGPGGRTLQFDGHLDTVHLPFVAPRIEDGTLYGQGSADMKGGLAAAIEALRILRHTGILSAGSILLTAHDHHEAPWGDSRQIHGLIEEGYVGDGVLLPEYLFDRITVAGRGQAVMEITVRREGDRIHEVLRPDDTPDVIEGAAEVIRGLKALNAELSKTSHKYVGTESAFVGQIHGGEIFNQSPVECKISGTRRWVSGRGTAALEGEFAAILADAADRTGTIVEGTFTVVRDAFQVSEDDDLVHALQSAHTGVTGESLPFGNKPFVDDGNCFSSMRGIPALTHGPAAEGAHTTNERVRIDELVRVAEVYAATAVLFCRC